MRETAEPAETTKMTEIAEATKMTGMAGVAGVERNRKSGPGRTILTSGETCGLTSKILVTSI